MLVVKSSSKIKWLIHNWKSGVMNVMYYIALAMAEATPIVAAYYFNIQISIITVLVSAILISVITYAIIRATHKSQFYLAMRNIAMYPIVILLYIITICVNGSNGIYRDIQRKLQLIMQMVVVIHMAEPDLILYMAIHLYIRYQDTAITIVMAHLL